MKFPLPWSNYIERKGYEARVAYVSHRGRVRMKNQDNFLVEGEYLPLEHGTMEQVETCEFLCAEGSVLALFDGMGGECAGELASYTAAKQLESFGKAEEYTEKNLTSAVWNLNRAVCRARHERRLPQIGTTMTMLAFQKNSLWLVNLGDSPAYQLHKQSFFQITCPHTNEQMLKEQGIAGKPGLTQFLGVEEEEFILEPHIAQYRLCAGDLYLLCSDGLTDMVPEEEIRKILQKKESIADMTRELLEQALQNGGRDNVTILLCSIVPAPSIKEKEDGKVRTYLQRVAGMGDRRENR